MSANTNKPTHSNSKSTSPATAWIGGVLFTFLLAFLGYLLARCLASTRWGNLPVPSFSQFFTGNFSAIRMPSARASPFLQSAYCGSPSFFTD